MSTVESIPLRDRAPRLKFKGLAHRELRRIVMTAQNFTCQHCGYRPADDRIPRDYDGRRTVGGHSRELQIDHVLPRARGGTNTLENLQILCDICNRIKCAR